jgi:hypothetical protein
MGWRCKKLLPEDASRQTFRQKSVKRGRFSLEKAPFNRTDKKTPAG